MTSVPILPLNVEEFFADPHVDDMGGEHQAMWLRLIAEAWRCKTLLPASDRALAKKLGIDVRRWRSFYKPVFAPLMHRHGLTEMSPTVGQTVADFYRIAKVNAVWDQVANRITRNKANAAHARAEKAAKAGNKPSAPEPNTAPATASEAEPAVEPAAALYQNQDKKGPGSGQSNGQATPAPAPIADDGSSRSGDLAETAFPPSRTPLIDKAKRIAEARIAGTTTVATGSSLFERLNAAKGEH